MDRNVALRYNNNYAGDETQHIFVQDAYGNTPLIKVCERGYVETARILLDHGTRMDHRSKVYTLQARPIKLQCCHDYIIT